MGVATKLTIFVASLFIKADHWRALIIKFFLLWGVMFFSGNFLLAQTTVNVASGTLQFLDANRVSIIGNGTAVGDKILYTNVITLNVNGVPTQIDCIVTTVSLTNATFVLPTGLSSPQTAHDVAASSSGTNYSSNSDAYFSPTFNFGSGGGSARFNFEFIVGGSYDAATNPTGTPIILENLRLNTYDLDGNGNANSFQYAEFGGFSSYTLGTTTRIATSYNSASGLTKFKSTTTSNVPTVTDSRQRAAVDFASVSGFDISVGSDAGGVSYFFMDFSAGVTWSPTTTTTTTYTPRLDLNTSTSGINNSVSDCYAVQSMTYGGTNLTNVSSGFVNEIIIDFLSTDILDGASEVMSIAGATGTNQLALNFSASGTQTFSLGGVTYSLAKSVASGVSSIRITKSPSGGWTTAQAEALLDSIRYANTASPKTNGTRTFGVQVREGSLLTPKANFIVQIPCTILTLKWVQFEVKKTQRNKVNVLWTVEEGAESEGFQLEISVDGSNWIKRQYLPTTGRFNTQNNYIVSLVQNTGVQTFYRVRNMTNTGDFSLSSNKMLTADATNDFRTWPNPVTDNMFIYKSLNEPVQVIIIDSYGRSMFKDQMVNKTSNVSSRGWPSGRYTLLLKKSNGEMTAMPFIKK